MIRNVASLLDVNAALNDIYNRLTSMSNGTQNMHGYRETGGASAKDKGDHVIKQDLLNYQPKPQYVPGTNRKVK